MRTNTVEDGAKTNFLAPEDCQTFIIAAAGRNESMKQVMALLREPPARPDVDSIPYLGDNSTYEQILVAARDWIALNVAGTWYRAEPGESEDEAYKRLKPRCFKTGRELEVVQLGHPMHVGGGGAAVPPRQCPPGGLFPRAPAPPGGGTPHKGPSPPPPIPRAGLSGDPPPIAPPVGPTITAPITRQTRPKRSACTATGLPMSPPK